MSTVNDESKLIHLFYCVPILILLTTPQTLWACLPHSPNDVFIARMQALSPVPDVNQPISFDVQFSNHRFVFRPFLTWFKYSKPKQWRSNFELKNIEKNELVIGLAYNPDGSKPADYTISSLATLRCENDTLIIGKPVVSFVAWNRENDSCRHNGATPIGILDGFFTENQAYYLRKLQEKYPTCSQLKSAFPIILENVNVVSDKQSSMKNKPTFWQHLKTMVATT